MQERSLLVHYTPVLPATDALMPADGQILICGGRRMANDVADTLNTVLAPVALDVAQLKKSGRLIEDSY